MKVTTITPDQFIQGNYMNKLDLLSDVLEDFCSKHNIPFMSADDIITAHIYADCLLYTSPSPRDKRQSRMPSSA